MNLYDLMMKRRSVRVLKDQETSESIIEQLVDVTNQAPTGGNIQNIEKYLGRAFVEALEADRLDMSRYVDRVKKEMKRLDIQNSAQFLFKVRYPTKVTVRMNQRLNQSFKNAGFEIF